MSLGGACCGLRRLNELGAAVVARRAGVEQGEPLRTDDRPAYAGCRQAESVPSVVLQPTRRRARAARYTRAALVTAPCRGCRRVRSFSAR